MTDPRADIFAFMRGLKPLAQADVDRANALLDALGAKRAAEAPVSVPGGVADVLGSYDRTALIAELRRDEGERLRAYKDTVGKWTIGIGRNLDDVGTAPLDRTVADVKAKGITSAESAAMLSHDLGRVEADLDRRLPWWRKLDPVRQRVMVNMCFNLGIGGLCGFVNTLKMIEEHRFTEAASNMLASKWARQVGARAQRLSAMMRTGAA